MNSSTLSPPSSCDGVDMRRMCLECQWTLLKQRCSIYRFFFSSFSGKRARHNDAFYFRKFSPKEGSEKNTHSLSSRGLWVGFFFTQQRSFSKGQGYKCNHFSPSLHFLFFLKKRKEVDSKWRKTQESFVEKNNNKRFFLFCVVRAVIKLLR